MEPLRKPIEAHSIMRSRLSGERVWVEKLEGCNVTIKRVLHTHDEGDIFKSEIWHVDELQTEAEYEAEHAKERTELLDALRRQGVMVLNDLSSLDVGKDPNAN